MSQPVTSARLARVRFRKRQVGAAAPLPGGPVGAAVSGLAHVQGYQGARHTMPAPIHWAPTAAADTVAPDMASVSHEQTINTALAEVLEPFGRGWRIRPENVGGVFEGAGRPDILIEKPDGWPIVIEAEVGHRRHAEMEARSRLRRKLASTGREVHTAVAVVYPESLREYHGEDLRKVLMEMQFEYAIYGTKDDRSFSRFPETGWISGSLAELALILHRSSLPSGRVDALADSLELGVVRAAGVFTIQHPHGSSIGEEIAMLLGQSDDSGGQTRRMAMAVIVNALVFHAALSEAEMAVPATPPRAVRAPHHFRSQGAFRPTQIIDEWGLILRVNYWPIFYTAGAILRGLSSRLSATLLENLWETAETLIVGGATSSHDLTGAVFQRLIADRKFLATFYTRPAAAALLAGLALPLRRHSTGWDWSDADALKRRRIGDFACGTGTLLSTAYHRVGLLHEIHGGDPASLHPAMMESGLVGLDILAVAVHLTAAMLAGIHPNTPFEGECLLTMPYGRYDWGVCVGSLDLLPEQTSFEVLQAAAQTAGGRGAEEVTNIVDRVGHGKFDLVIMNPPFTRHGAREGDRTVVHNPAFAAFGASEAEQDILSAHLHRLGTGGHAHGHAGLASYFVDLAHRKTARDGILALVLPLTALSGQSWEKIRSLWHSEYTAVIIVTISHGGSHSRSFSADTGMAECLFVAIKGRGQTCAPRASFVVLESQPRDTLVGDMIAHEITETIERGTVRTLEGGPYGGSKIVIGSTAYGEAVDCPIPTTGAWQVVGIRDISLGQTAYQLANGRLWIEGMPITHQLPVASIQQVVRRVGPHHLDITGPKVKTNGLPQGPFERFLDCPKGSAYPCLWNHNATRERHLIIEPDSHCKIRQVNGEVPAELKERASQRWQTASRVHYNCDLQFNSQSIIVGLTEAPSLGGRAWPTLILDDSNHDYAITLWFNSTLGLLCHWWMSNKTQAGRGTSTVTSIPNIATIDVRQLTAEQHDAAHSVFVSLQDRQFLPFDQIAEDESRALLDRMLLVDILGIARDVCAPGGPMERLRLKLSAEPSIHSDKKTRVVFTADGERTVPRGAGAA